MSHKAFSGDNPTHFVTEPVEQEREGVIVLSQACSLPQILANFEAIFQQRTLHYSLITTPYSL